MVWQTSPATPKTPEATLENDPNDNTVISLSDRFVTYNDVTAVPKHTSPPRYHEEKVRREGRITEVQGIDEKDEDRHNKTEKCIDGREE